MGPLRSTDRAVTPPTPEAARPAGTFRVASYNVENLFDAVDDPARKDEGTPPKDVEAMRKLAQTMKKVDADVVTMQEVENLDVLNQFLDQNLPGLYPYRVLVEGNDERGIDVAIASKYPIQKVTSHKDDRFPLPGGKGTTTFRRDLLRADVQVGAYPFSVYTTHFKAQGGGQRADDVRLAEAREARRLVQEEMKAYPGQRYVLTGDFNDTPDSAVGKVFLNPGEGHFEDALQGIPPGQRITHPVTNRSIDYILFPEEMLGEFRGGAIEATPEPERGSDHLMIYADFQFQDSSPKRP